MTTSLASNRPLLGQDARTGQDRLRTITASTTITQEKHDNQLILIDAAAGLTVTLPAAKGTGAKYKFLIKATVTSNNVIVQVANTTDAFIGYSNAISDDAGGPAKGFIASAASDDTVTLNGTTKGGYAGDTVEVTDIASGLFHVVVFGKATGTEATPFSAAV